MCSLLTVVNTFSVVHVHVHVGHSFCVTLDPVGTCVHVRGDEQCMRHVVVKAVLFTYNIYEIEFFISTMIIVLVVLCDCDTAYFGSIAL